MSPHGHQPQSWVAAYTANIRFLGAQMREAMRKLEESTCRTERKRDRNP